jgi:thioredoxin 1
MREVTDREFDDVVLRARHPVAVDFRAPWCGPCKAVEPVLEQLAAAHPNVDFVSLDIDAYPACASRYGVLSIPTVILFADGRPQQQVVGARRRSHYERAWSAWLGAAV